MIHESKFVIQGHGFSIEKEIACYLSNILFWFICTAPGSQHQIYTFVKLFH